MGEYLGGDQREGKRRKEKEREGKGRRRKGNGSSEKEGWRLIVESKKCPLSTKCLSKFKNSARNEFGNFFTFALSLKC